MRVELKNHKSESQNEVRMVSLKADYLMKSAFPRKMNATIDFLVDDLVYTDFLVG